MSQSVSKQKNSNLSLQQRKSLPVPAAAPSVAEHARLSNMARRPLQRSLPDKDFRAGLAHVQLQSLHNALTIKSH